MELPEVIRRGRGQHGWSQEYVGELLGVHHKTVGKWERGLARPRGRMLEQVLDVLYRDHGLTPPGADPAPGLRVADLPSMSVEQLRAIADACIGELTRRAA